MVEITTSGRTLNDGDLARVEKEMGCPLPPQYRAFLLRTNGGQPEPDTIDIEGAHFKGTVVAVFHGIDTQFKSSDLLWNLEVLEGCKENKLLPIGSDPYGHLFMLDLSAEHYGEVLYFDSAEIPPRPYLVAHDFNEFLSKIRDMTPEELALVEASKIAAD